MRLKKFAAIGLAALMAASTAGCGGGSGSASTEAPTTGATEATETSQAETAAESAEEKAEPEGNVDRSKELVVYSNSTSNIISLTFIRRTWELRSFSSSFMVM